MLTIDSRIVRTFWACSPIPCKHIFLVSILKSTSNHTCNIKISNWIRPNCLNQICSLFWLLLPMTWTLEVIYACFKKCNNNNACHKRMHIMRWNSTSWPSLTSISWATRAETLIAATLRGCVQPIWKKQEDNTQSKSSKYYKCRSCLPNECNGAVIGKGLALKHRRIVKCSKIHPLTPERWFILWY